MTAKRFNEGKAKLGYFARSFHWALEAVARVKEFGANKYDDGNWRLGGKPDDEYLDSAARHLDSFLSGEEYDQDSGCHHLGHVIWNYCALMENNYGSVSVIDKELFTKQMAFWAAKKLEPKEAAPGPTGWIAPPLKDCLIGGNKGPKRNYKNPSMIVRDDVPDGHFAHGFCEFCGGPCTYNSTEESNE